MYFATIGTTPMSATSFPSSAVCLAISAKEAIVVRRSCRS